MDLSLIKKHFYPRTVLDIGAHVGEFNRSCYEQFPGVNVLSIEGNEFCEPELKAVAPHYKILLLGKENKKVIFYKTKKNLTNTGDSIYRELTEHYSDELVMEQEKDLVTLDSCLSNPFLVFDLIKIDTQGSELDILEGGKQLALRAKGILLEVSEKPYNKDAPLYNDVISYMNSIGFEKTEILACDTRVGQLDILFINKNLQKEI